MSTTCKFNARETLTPSSVLKRLILRAALALVAAVCGFWVAGNSNLLYWIHEMSGWINGDNGPDLFHVLYETVKLIVRITIGGFGSYELLRRLIAFGQTS